MTRRIAAALGLSALAFASTALAQTASPPPFQGPALAQDRILSRAIGMLEVTSPAFASGGAIPLANSSYGKNISFPLNWSAVPGAKAYAVIMEDPDSKTPQPTLHWLAYNIAPGVTALSKGVHTRQEIEGAKSLQQGRNSKGGIGYVGPHPAVGDPPHHYHIQVFALSRRLPLGGGADLNQVIEAMNDRVLAEGELVATFEAPKPADDKAVAKPAKP